MKYSEAYSKIIEAYFRDEIKPNDINFCFCGTLQGSGKWYAGKHPELKYSHPDFRKMELQLFTPFGEYVDFEGDCPCFKDNRNPEQNIPDYEGKLFEGMCAALDVLKQIHRERGEDVDNLPALTKRQLQKA